MASDAGGEGSKSRKSPPIPQAPPPLIPVTSSTMGHYSPPSTSAQSPSAATPSSSSSSNTATSSVPARPSATASATGTRSRRQELSFAERIQVIMARKSGKSMRQLAVQVRRDFSNKPRVTLTTTLIHLNFNSFLFCAVWLRKNADPEHSGAERCLPQGMG